MGLRGAATKLGYAEEELGLKAIETGAINDDGEHLVLLIGSLAKLKLYKEHYDGGWHSDDFEKYDDQSGVI